MNRHLQPLLLLAGIILSLCTTAQTTTQPDTLILEDEPDTSAMQISPQPQKPYYLRNIVKMNLASLVFKNYNFSYERLIARKISVIAGFRTMPQTNLGTLKLSEEAARIAEDDQIVEDLSQISLSNKTITAEIRFYSGRKPGAKGFYFGLYGRTAGFNGTYNYHYNTGVKTYSIPLEGTSRGFAAGLVTGAQFAIAKRVTIDLYLLGVHYGKLTGDLDAATDLSGLSSTEQQELQNELNNLLVVNEKSYLSSTVNSTGVKGKISGPFAGLRGLGLTVGIAF